MSADDCFWSIRFKGEARRRAPARFALFYGSASADSDSLAQEVLAGRVEGVRWFNESRFLHAAFRDWLKSCNGWLPEYHEEPFMADYPAMGGHDEYASVSPPRIPERFRGEVKRH